MKWIFLPRILSGKAKNGSSIPTASSVVRFWPKIPASTVFPSSDQSLWPAWPGPDPKVLQISSANARNTFVLIVVRHLAHWPAQSGPDPKVFKTGTANAWNTFDFIIVVHSLSFYQRVAGTSSVGVENKSREGRLGRFFFGYWKPFNGAKNNFGNYSTCNSAFSTSGTILRIISFPPKLARRVLPLRHIGPTAFTNSMSCFICLSSTCELSPHPHISSPPY